MLADFPNRRRFSLHALVAEARRRARRRRVLLAVAAIALAGGGGTIYATHPFGSIESSAPTTSVPDYRPGGIPTSLGGGPTGWSTAELSTVAALSRTSAWIVGSVAWHWDGNAWRNIPLPSRHLTLSDVAAISPDNVWAVGERQSSIRTKTTISNWTTPVIEHWDGLKWSSVRLPYLPGARSRGALPMTELDSISASGPRNIWVLGQIYRGGDAPPLLLHWNGRTWLKQPAPWARPDVGAGPIIANGSSGVWFVDNGIAEHWNGSAWRAVPPPFGPHDGMAGFSATAWDDAWAVGSYGTGAKTKYGFAKYSRPLAAHWNGSTWAVTPLPDLPGDTGAELDSVVAVSPDDAWAVGLTERHRGLLVHWNGMRWSVTPGSGFVAVQPPTAIAAAPDGSAWVIGNFGNCGSGNVVVGWNGTTWAVVPHPRDVWWDPRVPVRERPSSLPSCASSGSGR